MFLRIENLPEKKLAGKYLTMSFLNNRTAELWQSFMPDRKNITGAVDRSLYSLQIFSDVFKYAEVDPSKEFVKWAAVEISDQSEIPNNLKQLTLEEGLYAVFLHKGTPADFRKTFDFIFLSWIPNSEFDVDHRPHFELLGEKYINNHPDSEEEIWIPIRKK